MFPGIKTSTTGGVVVARDQGFDALIELRIVYLDLGPAARRPPFE